MESRKLNSPELEGELIKKYPYFRGKDIAVIDSRGIGVSDGRKLEYYPADERDNPIPGKMTVQVFDPSFMGDSLVDVIAADFLHEFGKSDPRLKTMREKFRNSMTDEQRQIDLHAYNMARSGQMGPRESRPYDDWFETHRLDQYLGSQFLPEGSQNRSEWDRMITPQQRGILSELKGYLSGQSQR